MTAWTSDARKNLERLIIDLLELEGDIDWAIIRYQETRQWDSLVHMAIVSDLEEALSINLSAEDIVQMSTFDEILRILKDKGVDVG